jgi:hypothetical protein
VIGVLSPPDGAALGHTGSLAGGAGGHNPLLAGGACAARKGCERREILVATPGLREQYPKRSETVNGMQYPYRPQVRKMMLVLLCAALWQLTATAYAQFPKIGTVLGVPLADLDNFRRANTATGVDPLGQRVPPNDVTLLHVSPEAGPPFNTAIATVSVTSSVTGETTWRVFFPLRGDGTLSPLYEQINASELFANPRIIHTDTMDVVQMDVYQRDLVRGDTSGLNLEAIRYLLVPDAGMDRLQTENPLAQITSVHLQRMPLGSQLLWVRLVAIDLRSASRLVLPGDLASTILALNSNVTLTSGNRASVS